MAALESISLANNRRTGAFERRIARALAPYADAGVPLVVACSGGPDSLATLVAVARSRLALGVTAAHFDHRLRPAREVASERGLIQSVAHALQVPLMGGRAARPPDDRSESAAREARYRWLARACSRAGAGRCVTGHTLDDQAETVLLRLARGTGVAGAAGMATDSAWPIPLRGVRAPRLLRPLLGVTRTDVEAYLEALGLRAAADSSNATLDYARNRIRQRVLPELRVLNPRAAEQIAAFAERARTDNAALEAWAAAVLIAVTQPEARGPRERRIVLERRPVLNLPPAVATRVVRLAASRLGVGLERGQAEAALHAARGRGRRAALGAGVEALQDGEWLVLRAAGARRANLLAEPLA